MFGIDSRQTALALMLAYEKKNSFFPNFYSAFNPMAMGRKLFNILKPNCLRRYRYRRMNRPIELAFVWLVDLKALSFSN